MLGFGHATEPQAACPNTGHLSPAQREMTSSTPQSNPGQMAGRRGANRCGKGAYRATLPRRGGQPARLRSLGRSQAPAHGSVQPVSCRGRNRFAGSGRSLGLERQLTVDQRPHRRVAAGISTVSAALGLRGRAAFGGSRCQTRRGCSSKSVNSEHTCSTFLLPFTLYRWTESVTCTGSSLFAVGCAYSERHRKYSAPVSFTANGSQPAPRVSIVRTDTGTVEGMPTGSFRLASARCLMRGRCCWEGSRGGIRI